MCARKSEGLLSEQGGVSDAAEADVGGETVRRVRGSGGDAVAAAGGGVAEERASFHDLYLPAWRAGRVAERRCRRGGGEPEPVGAPLPYVSGDGVEAVAVGREAVYRAGARVAVFGGVFAGELALPDVAAVLAFGG
jgi:hypothetical protein